VQFSASGSIQARLMDGRCEGMGIPAKLNAFSEGKPNGIPG